MRRGPTATPRAGRATTLGGRVGRPPTIPCNVSNTFVLAAFPLEALQGEGSGGAVHPGSFCKRGAERPRYRHGILGARTRTSQLASPPGGTRASAFRGGPRFAVRRDAPRAAPPREPRQGAECHGAQSTGIRAIRVNAGQGLGGRSIRLNNRHNHRRQPPTRPQQSAPNDQHRCRDLATGKTPRGSTQVSRRARAMMHLQRLSSSH